MTDTDTCYHYDHVDREVLLGKLLGDCSRALARGDSSALQAARQTAALVDGGQVELDAMIDLLRRIRAAG